MSARAGLLLLALGLLATPAWAHRLQLELFREGTELRCELFFSDGVTPEGAELILTRLEGDAAQELARATSDAGGVARFTLPGPGRYRVEARDASLHLATAEVELPADASPAPVSSAPARAPQPHAPARPWGGALLGVLVIAGLAGGLALWQARRRP
ncbi:MAG: hypothetical protein R3F62_30100 [Planctomycetota bacterium]